MAATKPRISKDEFAERGELIFMQHIEPLLAEQDPDAFVAIDIETGQYEIDVDETTATDRLLADAQCPDLASANWLTVCPPLWF